MTIGGRPAFARLAAKREALSRRLRRAVRRHLGGETVEPGDELGISAPPRAVEAEIAIAERAGERDLADGRRRIDRRRRSFERGERAGHLAGLMLEPFRLVGLRLAPPRLVDGEDRGIEQAVA